MTRYLEEQHARVGSIDEEVLGLVEFLNTLPGVTTTSSCCGHGLEPVSVEFDVDPGRPEGLFVLLRATDPRYWRHGANWSVRVGIVDAKRARGLPFRYTLHSVDLCGEVAYAEQESLIQSVRAHLGHRPFVAGFGLSV